MSDVTINVVNDKKMDLQMEIASLVNKFEKETGVQLVDLYVNRMKPSQSVYIIGVIGNPF
ncbi:MAG TPA: hypothetical protein ENH82_13215 [bacterium]|nr:hypothetical protein [bacterium]